MHLGKNKGDPHLDLEIRTRMIAFDFTTNRAQDHEITYANPQNTATEWHEISIPFRVQYKRITYLPQKKC